MPNDIHVFRLAQLKKLRKTKAKEAEIAPEKQFQKLKLQGDELLLRHYMFKKKFISNMRSKPTIKPGINVCISCEIITLQKKCIRDEFFLPLSNFHAESEFSICFLRA